MSVPVQRLDRDFGALQREEVLGSLWRVESPSTTTPRAGAGAALTARSDGLTGRCSGFVRAIPDLSALMRASTVGRVTRGRFRPL
jgi:hypothetical protein